MLDHHYIEDNQIVDRFVMGKLSDEEHEQFSQHIMDCDLCLDQLELAEAFQRDLKTVAVQNLTIRAKQGMLTMFLRSRIAGGIAMAAAAVLIMAMILPGSGQPTQIVTLSSSTRSAQAATPVELFFSEKITSYTLVKAVILSSSERGVARFRAALMDENQTRVLAHEAPVNDDTIRLQLDRLPPGDYQLSLELAKDGRSFQGYETFRVHVSP